MKSVILTAVVPTVLLTVLLVVVLRGLGASYFIVAAWVVVLPANGLAWFFTGRTVEMKRAQRRFEELQHRSYRYAPWRN